MKRFLQKYGLLQFIFLFVGIQFLYFITYTYLLYSSVSIIQLLFIIIVMSSYAVLLYGLQRFLWQGLLYMLLGAFYFWSLINFVHFKVFGTFLTISFSSINSFDGGIWDLISSFSRSIPWFVYLLSICFFILSIIHAVWFFRSKKKAFLYTSFNFERRSMSTKCKYAAGYLVLFIMINCVGGTLVAYLDNHPKDSWWNLKAQVIDYGFVGHTYAYVFDALRNNIPVYAQENHFLDSTANMSPLEELQSLYDLGPVDSTYSSDQDIINGLPQQSNILMVQLESVSLWAVDNIETPMPFLKSLIDSNISVDNFYPNSCKTINAEFAANCSFVPNSFDEITVSQQKEQAYTCLPRVLRDEHGYATYYFHANLPTFYDRESLLPQWGFDNLYLTPYYRQKAYDTLVFEDAIDRLSTEEKPFYAYITSFTSHGPHDQELMDYYNERYGDIIKPFEGQLSDYVKDVEINEQEVRMYFGFLTAVDNALQDLFIKLHDTGLDKNTVVMIYNDHRYYNFKTDAFELYNKVPFTMIVPQHVQKKVASYASHIDFAPTILQMIEKDSYKPRQQFLGTSLLQDGHKAQILNKCQGKIFYKTSDVLVRGNQKAHVYQAAGLNNNISPDILVREKLYTRYLVNTTDTVLNGDELILKD